jgi:hypothetical protein
VMPITVNKTMITNAMTITDPRWLPIIEVFFCMGLILPTQLLIGPQRLNAFSGP